ncbi:hypothetical protein TNIN_202221 [Trichonephila inaurata madagascariensis]|uniref:Uncharacterized protein n=1 Tax=Trichonephila inaurata madagascariensis TaxID=2747483 RepID=A0A8X7C5Y6_9ARAC|nr:hypothetical protein TNIN_202221 [Trichonephila inaurata madagascariensis]
MFMMIERRDDDDHARKPSSRIVCPSHPHCIFVFFFEGRCHQIVVRDGVFSLLGEGGECGTEFNGGGSALEASLSPWRENEEKD